jgi:hypothetical protein
VPYPSDPRQPPARTFSQLTNRLSIEQLLPGGVQRIAPDVRQAEPVRVVAASNALDETIASRQTLSQDLFPSGPNPILFRVLSEVVAAAAGEYSDIRIRGSEGRRNFRVRALNPRVQRVLEPSDPCFSILNPP